MEDPFLCEACAAQREYVCHVVRWFAMALLTAIKFSSDVEVSWLLASVLGFTLDVLVYHTFSLWVRAVMKLLVSDHVCMRVEAGGAECAAYSEKHDAIPDNPHIVPGCNCVTPL